MLLRHGKRRSVWRSAVALAAGAALAGCAAAFPGSLRERTLQEVVAAVGTPTGIFDLAPGVRQFEWTTSDAVLLEESDYEGDPSWWTTAAPVSGGGLVGACKLVVVGRWDAARGAWIVERVKAAPAECRGTG